MTVRLSLSKVASILWFLMQASFSGAAWAQISVIQKTSTETPPPSQVGFANPSAWSAVPVTCFFVGESSSPRPSATQQDSRTQPQGSKAGTCEAEARAAVSAQFESQRVAAEQAAKTGTGEQQSSGSAAMERLFQLSETLEWHIDSGEADGSNLVAVFASRTLYQGTANSSLKFDAGVNVEAKTGNTAGLAGFVVAW